MTIIKQQVAVFGGAFDPPHLGHQRVGQEVLKQDLVDQVWYVPVYEHPWRNRLDKLELAPYKDRLAMTELILPPQAQLKEYQDVSYAYDSLNFFQEKHPNYHFSWIIGSEYLANFSDWQSANALLAEYAVYVYPRANYPLAPLLPGMKALKDLPTVEISSSLVKCKLQKGEPIQELVGQSVWQYIKKRNLYQSTNSKGLNLQCQ